MKNILLFLGCFLGLMGSVGVNAQVTANLDATNPTCGGFTNGTITAMGSGGLEPYTYQWSTGETTQTIDGINVGTYTVTVTDLTLEFDVASISLTSPPQVNANIIIDDFCAGNVTVPATGGVLPYTYDWNDGASGETRTGLLKGVQYCISVLDVNVCGVITCIIIPNSDSLALVSLYNATDGANWTNPWILTNPISTWEGVETNTDGCVIELNLFNRNLNGTLPNLNLPNVIELRIINDQGAPANLTGAVPSFSNMPLLEQINLGGNGFTSLPSVAEFTLPNLWYFSVAQNQISGSLPDYNLPALEQIYFSENNLTGIIPNFSGMPVLERLHFHSNALGGTLPDFTNHHSTRQN